MSSLADEAGLGRVAGTVRVRRPPEEPVRLLNFRERVSPSLWYTPGLFIVGAFLLSKLTVVVDQSVARNSAPSWLLATEPDAATALTSTVAAAMLTFVAVVFSTTLVAIQLAGSQYSPRVVRVFVRSRLTHVTLGFFLATFVFALNALVEIVHGDEPFVPTLTVVVTYLLLIGTLAMFVAFIHGMSRMLRVQYLLDRVTTDGGRAMLRALPPADVYSTAVAPPEAGRYLVRSRRHVGVIQAIDRSALVELAAARGVWVEMTVEVGEFIGSGTPIAYVHGDQAGELSGDDIADLFLLGAERTLIQDPGFGLRQLVDVAIRALSPAVNDPTTAVQCLDRINHLLGSVADRPDPDGWYVDRSGSVRLLVREPTLRRLVLLAYVEIIRYGGDSPQVVRRVRAALNVLDGLLRADLRPTVGELRALLDRTSACLMPDGFASLVEEADRHGLG